MSPRDDENREREGAPEGERPDEADGEGVKRSEPNANAAPGAHDSELHPDTPETMQHDHESAEGRQSYADARPGDYSRDFQEDSSGGHPVKPLDEDEVDEDGVPEIAAREPGERPEN